jgi:hypothetical protein
VLIAGAKERRPAMFTSEIVAYLWHLWVDLFGGLGLPWSKQVTAGIALAAVFYLVGWCFKFLNTHQN